jgi:hypothetical protein
MPEMNKPNVNIPAQNYNPVSAASGGLNKLAGGLAGRGRDAFNAKVAVHMQGQQHQHEKDLQTSSNEHERGLALIHGAAGIETAKIGARAQVAVARAHGASQVDIARVQADSAEKQQAAGHRHTIRLDAQQHQQDLEKQAQTHHQTVHAGIVDALNRRAEQQQANDHALATQKLADTHADNSSQRSTAFLETLRQHAEPGTEVNINHEGVKATYTTRSEKPSTPEAPKQETPAAPAPEAPKAPEEPAAPKTPALVVNHPVTGALVRRDSLSPKELALADAKKSGKKPVKKAAAKKAAPKKKR